jgi:hypothetical protein
MATTTNYGWTTPDDTGLVKDGAAAIRSLGTAIDTTTKNLNPSTTLGDIEYRSSTSNTNTRLAIGSTGQVLTVSGGVPSWATPAGGGKVLQVVQGTTTTSTAIATATYTDTTITATITPSANTSKVLILISAEHYLYRASGANEFAQSARIMRGATAILTNGNASLIGAENVNGKALANQNSWVYLDSPATTSSTTYKLQAKTDGTTSVTYQVGSDTSVITLLEIGA